MMNRLRKTLLPSLALSLLLTTGAFSQEAQTKGFTAESSTAPFSSADTLVLDLPKSLEIALDMAPEIVRARRSVDLAKLSLRSARLDLYGPSLRAELDAPSYQQNQNEQLLYDPDAGKTVRTWVNSENMRWDGDLVLEQPLPTGGQFQLRSNLYRRYFSSDVTGEDERELEYNTSWRVLFSQELLQGNVQRLAARRADVSLQRALTSGSSSRRQLAYRVLESYYTLLESARELEIVRQDLEASRETAELARRKYDAGLVAEVEALELEVEVATKEAELSSAESAYDSRLDRYKLLLGLELDQAISIVGEPKFKPVDIDLQSAIDRALEYRDDVQLAQLDVREAEYGLRDAKRPWRPSGMVTAFYSLTRQDTTFSGAFATDYDAYNLNRGFTFTLRMPLFSSGRRALEVQRARLQLRGAEYDSRRTREEVILEVRERVRSVREARTRYELSLRSLRIAESSYEITRNRFENGQVNARDWIQVQLTLTRNRLNALGAKIDHILAVAAYRVAIGGMIRVEDL